VRELSILLFDQLQAVHHLPAHSRVLLEAGALLHDTGHMISHRGHHKHGEYLALNGDIAGLEGRDRAIAAALVRYHNRKSGPAGHHTAYSSLNDADKRITRRLAAILRIAEALDHSHRQRVMKIRASFQRGAVGLQVHARGDATEDLRDANRSAELFEKEFHVSLYFRQSPAS
jgi:exopolyphosphatase/guanosine-5'-triphosphate,3'-diphosphate pyrophosphatase